MKRFAPYVIAIALMHAGVAAADVVENEVPDTIAGKGFGALAGFMAGAAAGGPVGAVIGVLAGGWSGALAQEATGLHGTAYRVEGEDGSAHIVRSPAQRWRAGDEVEVVRGRLMAAGQTADQPCVAALDVACRAR